MPTPGGGPETAGTELDHLVVAARSLREGREWCLDALEVEAAAGGSHDGLGTHNVLVSLGARRYLEVIAVDPEASTPAAPRWFGLDTDEVRERVASSPALIAWVARCIGRDDSVEHLSATPGYGVAIVRPASRDALRWRFAFDVDGDRFGQGVFPHLIQWDSPEHPADGLPGSGLALAGLDLVVPEPAPVQAMLDALRLDQEIVHVVAGQDRRLIATLVADDGSVLTIS